MANAYCTIAQLAERFDERTLAQLSNDSNQRIADNTRIQTALDDAASELETALSGRFTLPLTAVPAILTRWVATRAVAAMYMRRTDRPKSIESEAKWCEEFLGKIIDGNYTLPGNERASVAVLQYSESLTGRSRFDNIRHFDRPASDTSTSLGD